jgi:hypothetical protein
VLLGDAAGAVEKGVRDYTSATQSVVIREEFICVLSESTVNSLENKGYIL